MPAEFKWEPPKGGHLQVESIKTVAAATVVPARYIRPELELQIVPVDAVGFCTLPVIDLASLSDPLLATDETAKLGAACREWGIFQLINHKMDTETLQAMKRDITEFFALPGEETKAVAIDPDSSLEGFGQHWIFSEDQKLDWVDDLFLLTWPPERRNLRLWPTNPASFRESLHKYSMEVSKVVARLLKCIAADLGIEEDVLLGIFTDMPAQSMRFNYYPSCPLPSKVMGLSPHTDAAAVFTVLLHVNDVPGLQIQKDGEWLAVQALPGALVVNVCDILEIMSNGEYKSVVHRAVLNKHTERISIAAFHIPRPDSIVGPLPELGEILGKPTKYKSVDFKDYGNAFLSSKLNGDNLLETMKIE